MLLLLQLLLPLLLFLMLMLLLLLLLLLLVLFVRNLTNCPAAVMIQLHDDICCRVRRRLLRLHVARKLNERPWLTSWNKGKKDPDTLVR